MLSNDLKNLTSRFELSRSEHGVITLSGQALDTVVDTLRRMHEMAEHFESLETPCQFNHTQTPGPVGNVIYFPVVRRPHLDDQQGGAS